MYGNNARNVQLVFDGVRCVEKLKLFTNWLSEEGVNFVDLLGFWLNYDGCSSTVFFISLFFCSGIFSVRQ